MNVLTKLWSALRSLADNLTGLADTVQAADRGLKQRLGLEPEAGYPDALEHAPRRDRQRRADP
jgi:hypothetical protein